MLDSLAFISLQMNRVGYKTPKVYGNLKQRKCPQMTKINEDTKAISNRPYIIKSKHRYFDKKVLKVIFHQILRSKCEDAILPGGYIPNKSKYVAHRKQKAQKEYKK